MLPYGKALNPVVGCIGEQAAGHIIADHPLQKHVTI